ncbi:TerD family protein [Antrihabitans spumae]|uniref:TerD family protein n=1 Tax=Antrihabitans spumae TaxID=3373370 RepID=A0ABW7KGG7_9NOCA
MTYCLTYAVACSHPTGSPGVAGLHLLDIRATSGKDFDLDASAIASGAGRNMQSNNSFGFSTIYRHRTTRSSRRANLTGDVDGDDDEIERILNNVGREVPTVFTVSVFTEPTTTRGHSDESGNRTSGWLTERLAQRSRPDRRRVLRNRDFGEQSRATGVKIQATDTHPDSPVSLAPRR